MSIEDLICVAVAFWPFSVGLKRPGLAPFLAAIRGTVSLLWEATMALAARIGLAAIGKMDKGQKAKLDKKFQAWLRKCVEESWLAIYGTKKTCGLVQHELLQTFLIRSLVALHRAGVVITLAEIKSRLTLHFQMAAAAQWMITILACAWKNDQ